MNESLHVCVLSKESWWDMRRARKHLLYGALSSHVQSILYINAPRLWWRPVSVQFKKSVPNNMSVFTPYLVFPGERFQWIRCLNRYLVSLQVKQRWNKAGHKVLSFYNPRDVEAAIAFRQEALVIYDWTEDWVDFYKDESLRTLQKRAVLEADAVVTVTQELAIRACELRGDDRVLWLPNASGLSIAEFVPHEKLKDIPEPRVGYIGHLGPWFDAAFVRALAEQSPEWSFVCVGGVGDQANKTLEGVSNVYCLGIQPFEELSSFMAGFEVCMAPYQKGFSGDASKLYDYLTSGKPIVTKLIPNLERFGDSLYIAEEVEQWRVKIRQAMAEVPEYKEQRLDVARQHTWNHRTEELLTWLSSMRS